jgi:hypothetical protein
LDRKLADLKAYRRARGLCDHCGEKWQRGHTCAQQVNLHVLDEIYALFSTTDSAEDTQLSGDADHDDVEEVCCCLSSDTSVVSGAKTLQLYGQFQTHPMLILVDSGSSASFISQQFLSKLSISPTQCKAISVRVANGDLMQCSTQL